MKKWLVGILPVVTAGFVACSSSTVTPETDGGSDASTTPTGTSTGTSPTSTGTAQDAAVPLPDPASFDLTSGACPQAAPCGGTLEGTWDYSAACISNADLASFEAQIRKGCPTATVSGVSGTMAGRVTFSGKNVTRKGTVELATDLTIPSECAAQAGGDCALVAAAITSGSGGAIKKTTCTAAGGGCACKVELSIKNDKIGMTFTTSGNTLTTSDGDEYDYCVTGTKLTHKQSKAGSSTSNEPGSFEATKR